MLNKFDESYDFETLYNQFIGLDNEDSNEELSEEETYLQRVREAVSGLKSNKNFKIVTEFLKKTYLNNYPMIKDPVEASQELAFRRGLSLIIQLVENN